MTTTQDAERWVQRFHVAAPDSVELLCLPHAGGSAGYYFGFSRDLPARVQVTAIQYPGRQERRTEPAITDLTELARRIHQVLRARPGYGVRPIALFGHSLGAGVAFELARLLEQDGVIPEALFVSGRRAPSRARAEFVHQADDDSLIAEVTSLDGTAPTLLADPEIRALMLPVLRADYTAAETYQYRPGPPLTGPISALTGLDDPKVSVPEALAWRDHGTGPFDLHTFPGGHFYLAQHHQAVLDAVVTRLDRKPAEEGPSS
jgi:pyochelin biosynthetic protein PchC